MARGQVERKKIDDNLFRQHEAITSEWKKQ